MHAHYLLSTAREITRYAERAPSFPLLQQASTNPRYHQQNEALPPPSRALEEANWGENLSQAFERDKFVSEPKLLIKEKQLSIGLVGTGNESRDCTELWEM